MDDFTLLKALQKELIDTLDQRKKVVHWCAREVSVAKIRRLRLQIQEVMRRIEKQCCGCYIPDAGETWHD